MKDKPLLECYEQSIKDLKYQESEVKKLKGLNRKLTTELIQVKEEKAHNEQLLDAFQNTLADFGYKLVDAHE